MARSQERADLAAAIASLKNGERELADATAAEGKSFEHVLDTQKRLDEARAELVEARDDADDLADRFIESGGADVLELARPRADLVERIATIERELDLWRRTHKACEERLPCLRFSVDTRRSKVDELAAGVMATSLEFATRRYEHLREEATAALAIAEYLHGIHVWEYADDRKASARRLHGIPESFRSHPARQSWQAAFEKLRADADATLPEL